MSNQILWDKGFVKSFEKGWKRNKRDHSFTKTSAQWQIIHMDIEVKSRFILFIQVSQRIHKNIHHIRTYLYTITRTHRNITVHSFSHTLTHRFTALTDQVMQGERFQTEKVAQKISHHSVTVLCFSTLFVFVLWLPSVFGCSGLTVHCKVLLPCTDKLLDSDLLLDCY